MMKTTNTLFGLAWRMSALALLVIVAVAGCDMIRFGRDAVDAQEPEEPIFAVATAQVGQERLVDSIRVNGDIESAATIDVFPDVFGDVHELNVRIGDRVEQGEIIAKIDQSRPGQSFVPGPVRAPIGGTITSVPVRVGAKVQQGQPVARIATTGDLQIRTYVPERYIGQLELGQEAEIEFAAFRGETFGARVVELSPVVDPATRTMETKLEFTEPDARIRPGMFARIRIITEVREDVPVVPVDAVVTRRGSNLVFVITGDERVERREVELGLQTAERVEIISGVSIGERITVEGQNQLDDGVRVRLIDEEEEETEAEAR